MNTNYKKDFVPYEQALALKELGFDEPCFGYYNTTWSKQNELLFPQYAGELENWNEMTHLCSAPLYQQAFSFFRENHDLYINVTRYNDEGEDKFLYYIDSGDVEEEFNTNVEAVLACLVALIKIVKQQTHATTN